MEGNNSVSTSQNPGRDSNDTTPHCQQIWEEKEHKNITQPAKVKKKIAASSLGSVQSGKNPKKSVSRRLFEEEESSLTDVSITSVQKNTKMCLLKVPDIEYCKNVMLGLGNECLSNNNNLHEEANSSEASQVLVVDKSVGVCRSNETASVLSDIPNTSSRDHTVYAKNNKKRHICEYCQKCFKSNGKLNSHIYSHTGERPFKCTKCTKAFSSKFKLVRHCLIHSKVRKFVCQICDRTFLRNDHLKNHIKIHDPLKTVYTCDRLDCDKKYSSLLSYKKHLAVHLVDDGSLICYLCNQKYETKTEIQLHLKSHFGSRVFKTQKDKKFKCQFCDRLFLTRKDVTRHLVVHTGNRDFLCQFCPQRFGRKDHLVRHIKKTHSTEKKGKVKIALRNNERRTEKKKEESLPELLESVPNIFIVPNNSIILVKNEKNEVNFEKPVLVTNETLITEPTRETKESATKVDEAEKKIGIVRPSVKVKAETGDKTDGIEFRHDKNDVLPIIDETEPNVLTDSMELSKDIFEDGCDDFDSIPLLNSGDFDGSSLNLGVDENLSCDIRDDSLNLLASPSGGEILRNLLMSNDDILSTPLPGFNQIFHSPTPN